MYSLKSKKEIIIQNALDSLEAMIELAENYFDYYEDHNKVTKEDIEIAKQSHKDLKEYFNGLE